LVWVDNSQKKLMAKNHILEQSSSQHPSKVTSDNSMTQSILLGTILPLSYSL